MPYKDKEKERKYQQEYHLRTWGKRKIRHKELRSIRRRVLATWLRGYKKNLQCILCNENHPACLDFHHKNRDDKDSSVANMVSEGYSTESIMKEIGKCIVLCRNCHAKTHYAGKSFDLID